MIKFRQFPSALKDRQRYRQQIDKLYQQYSRQHRLSQEDQDGLTINNIYLDQQVVAHRLINAVSQGKYRLSPAREEFISISGKSHRVHNLSFLDRVVQNVLHEWLLENVVSLTSPHVYYRDKGEQPPARQAVKQFIEYLHHIHNSQGQLDVYVFSAKLHNYFNRIPIGASSQLWTSLNTLMDALVTGPARSYLQDLLDDSLRPVLINADGLRYQRIVGVPTSSASLISLLYLRELDMALGELPGAFYARYGGNFLFAHIDLKSFHAGEACVTSILQQLQLSHTLKDQRIYLTRAGKASATDLGLKAADRIHYLGYAIHADGSLELSPDYLQKFLAQIRQRAKNCIQLLPEGLDANTRGKILCQAINGMLEIHHPLCIKISKRILTEVDNRGCLKQLDYAIALNVAELISGIRGVRAWRHVPYKTIRRDWHLVSLCQSKNEALKK